MKLIAVSAGFVGLLAITGLAVADHPKHPPHGPPHGPPKEAVDACTKKAEGDSCSFSIHDHDLTGTCDAGPDGKGVLACRPDGPPPGPPPEALQACEKSSRGDACSFTDPDGNKLTGTCDGPEDRPLACGPARD